MLDPRRLTLELTPTLRAARFPAEAYSLLKKCEEKGSVSRLPRSPLRGLWDSLYLAARALKRGTEGSVSRQVEVVPVQNDPWRASL